MATNHHPTVSELALLDAFAFVAALNVKVRAENLREQARRFAAHAECMDQSADAVLAAAFRHLES